MESDKELDREKAGITQLQEIHIKMEDREKNKIWILPSGKDKLLDLYIKNVKDDIIKSLKQSTQSYITEDERKAIENLMNDDSIVICPVDKRTVTVMLSTEDYIK